MRNVPYGLIFIIMILLLTTIVQATEVGERSTYIAGRVEFHMRLAPASTFPMGLNDSEEATVSQDFWIAETPVTYELWYEVRTWAEGEGYLFANAGMEGSVTGGGDWPDFYNVGQPPTEAKQEPVTMVNRYDSIVWCNTLSVYLGYDPVYTMDGEVVKNSIIIEHAHVVAEERDGFRLPTNMEWELAARYKGSDITHRAIEYPCGSRNYWTPGIYASGATGPAWIGGYIDGRAGDMEATKRVAWFSKNSHVDESGQKTQDVGQKPPSGNTLGLFDMSGNVFEWCFAESGSFYILRGGAWHLNAGHLRVGNIDSNTPCNVGSALGFRFVRNAP